MAKAAEPESSPDSVQAPLPQSWKWLNTSSLVSPKAAFHSEDEQVSFLQHLHRHYLEEHMQLQAETTLLEALAIRCRQRPATELVLPVLKDLCAFYHCNVSGLSEKVLVEVETFAGDEEVPLGLGVKALEGQAELLYCLGNKLAAFRLLKKVAVKAAKCDFDFRSCLEKPRFLDESAEDWLEAGHWALLKSASGLFPCSAEYSQAMEQSLSYFSTHTFTSQRSAKLCLSVRNAIKRLCSLPDDIILRWISHLRGIRSQVLDNDRYEDCILEALVHITSLMQVNRGCYALMSWWWLRSREQFQPERGWEAVPQLLAVWRYEMKHARVSGGEERLGTEVPGWLVALQAYAVGESVHCREAGRRGTCDPFLFRRMYV